MVVRNPQWHRDHAGCFRFPSTELLYGARVLDPFVRARLGVLGVRRAVLAGPNVQHEPEHVAQLCCEIAHLEVLTLYNCVLGHSAIDALAQGAPELNELVLVSGWSAPALAGLGISNLRAAEVTVVGCELDTAAVRALASLRGLAQLTFVDCSVYQGGGGGRHRRQPHQTFRCTKAQIAEAASRGVAVKVGSSGARARRRGYAPVGLWRAVRACGDTLPQPADNSGIPGCALARLLPHRAAPARIALACVARNE